MDALSEVLQDFRLSGVNYGRCELRHPWSIAFPQQQLLRFHFVSQGPCWIDQGKTSNIPGLAIMADVRGITIPEAGTTRFRPPFTPVSFGAIAGERYGDLRPHRLTPMHDWHLANSARTYEAGLWHRPMIDPKPISG